MEGNMLLESLRSLLEEFEDMLTYDETELIARLRRLIMQTESSLLYRLRIRLDIKTTEEDALLVEMLETASQIFLAVRYPTTPYPTDDNDKPVFEQKYLNIISSIAIELYSKLGAEGQTAHNENGINRSYEAGDISPSLLAKITPVVGIARA